MHSPYVEGVDLIIHLVKEFGERACLIPRLHLILARIQVVSTRVEHCLELVSCYMYDIWCKRGLMEPAASYAVVYCKGD